MYRLVTFRTHWDVDWLKSAIGMYLDGLLAALHSDRAFREFAFRTDRVFIGCTVQLACISTGCLLLHTLNIICDEVTSTRQTCHVGRLMCDMSRETPEVCHVV